MAEPIKPPASSGESPLKGDDFLSKFQQDAARLTEDLATAKSKLKNFEEKVKDLDAEKAKALTEASQLAREKKEAEAKSAEWKGKATEFQAKTTELQARTTELQSKLTESQAKAGELQAWQDEAIERARTMFGKHEELIRALEETELSEQAAQTQLQEARQRISRLESFEKDVELLRQDNLKMQKTLTTSEQASQQQRAELEQDKLKLSQSVEAEKQRLSSLEQEKNKLSQVLSEKDKGLSETKTVLEQAREAMARSQRMAEQAMQELELKKRDLESLQMEKVQQEKTLQALKNEQATLQQTLSASNAAAQKEFEQEKQRFSQNLAEKEKGLTRVKSDLDLMRETMAGSQKMAEQAMAELTESRNKSKLLGDELERAKRLLEDERVATQKRLDDRQQEYQKLQASVTAVQIKLDEAHEKLAKGERDHAASQRRIQQLEEASAAAREALRGKELELEAIRRELDPLQEALTRTQAELHQSRSDLAANNHELEFILSRMGFLSEKINPGSGQTVAAALQTVKASSPASVPSFASRPPAPLVSQVAIPAQGGGVFSMNGINLEQLALVDFPGDVPITISELLCACLDSNWREAWLASQKPDVFRLIPREAPVAAGGHFYEVIEEFVDWLISTEAVNQGAGEWGEQELWKALHDMFLEQRLNEFVAQGQFNETNFLSRRLRAFCQRISQLRQRTPGFRGWGHVFPPDLIDVPRAVFPMGDCRLVVTGTMYGTRSHPDFGLELVDYKVLPAPAEGNHLLPLALNALILGALRPNLSFGLGLETFSPDWEFTPVTHQSINALLREKVVPVFYELVNRPVPADLKNSSLEFIRTPPAPAHLR